jgi:phage terminase large subunit GpA-like protein
VWWNTSLGLSFEENLEQTPIAHLTNRKEDFSLDRIPNEVVFLTIGGDTQDDRVEISFLGWGVNQECYVLDHVLVIGNTTQSDVWNAAERLISKDFYRKDGSIIKLNAGCFDSGGHSTLQVYQFCTRQLQQGRKVFAIRGKEGNGPAFEYRAKVSGTHKAHRYYNVSVGTTKDVLFSRLKLNTNGENFIHFSHKMTEEYYNQLTSEAPKFVESRGVTKKIWVTRPATRREASDCWRYGFAALYSDNGVSYQRTCEDYLFRMKNAGQTTTDSTNVTRSGYLEKLRYR